MRVEWGYIYLMYGTSKYVFYNSSNKREAEYQEIPNYWMYGCMDA